MNECYKTAIVSQTNISLIASEMRIDIDKICCKNEFEIEIQKTFQDLNNLAIVGKEMNQVKQQIRLEIQNGLRQLDNTNREIERFASVQVLRQACNNWQKVSDEIKDLFYILQDRKQYKEKYQTRLSYALLKSDFDNINKIHLSISPHLENARNKLREAEIQESTFLGKTSRSIGRLFDRASKSRIGKELSVSFKSLVLGTKMFYDLMDMNSSTDLFAWAGKYNEDMNKIIEDVNEIQKMDGWSITGKNTIIEDIANLSYEKSFDKKSEIQKNSNNQFNHIKNYDDNREYRPEPKADKSSLKLNNIDNYTFDNSSNTGTLTDIDGNVYKTVKIGNQLWMAENLRVAHYSNGAPIRKVTVNSIWPKLDAGACTVYNNKYGLLYNGYAVIDSRKLAPNGWHIATDEDWKQLEMYLGMSQTVVNSTGLRGTNQGSKIKDSGSWNGTNQSGFTAIPGGYRHDTLGNLHDINYTGTWWSSTVSGSKLWSRGLHTLDAGIHRTVRSMLNGHSVRCVKD